MVKYVITDGKRWIRKDSKGRYVPTNSGAMAAEFTKKYDNIELVQLNSFGCGLDAEIMFSCGNLGRWKGKKCKIC